MGIVILLNPIYWTIFTDRLFVDDFELTEFKTFFFVNTMIR